MSDFCVVMGVDFLLKMFQKVYFVGDQFLMLVQVINIMFLVQFISKGREGVCSVMDEVVYSVGVEIKQEGDEQMVSVLECFK